MGRLLVIVSSAIATAGCAGVVNPATGVPEPAGDPTPLAKCRVAASANNPLVTEWPASEKAHLQSLAHRHVVAVEYTGCELRVIPDCVMPGTYAWNRTTLATDTLEIRNADELYAKLPIGAVALEGELARSGGLAVQTTVAGQLRAEPTGTTPATPACQQATHYVSAITVGAFKLLSGAQTSNAGGIGVMGVGAGAQHSAGKSVLRTAGDPVICAEQADDKPNMDCASPIQLFLTRISQPAVVPAIPGQYQAPQTQDQVSISFLAPGDASEVWSLRNADGVQLCQLPCTTWVPRFSGYSLRREQPLAEIEFPGKLTLTPGSSARANYRAERGSPILSKLNFYFLGLPTAAIAVGFGIWGATQAGKECKDRLGQPDDCFPGAGFLFLTSGMMAGIAGASLWWFGYSHDAELTFAPGSGTASRPPQSTFMFGPNGLRGTF